MDLREIAQAECARFGVPGAAVAAVAGGETVLAEGFGLRNDSDPVTPSTLYMLASDTKCFAAVTLCLLVEDGLLDLDAPVRKYLPWFAMHDDRVSEWVTTRDLLAHRTGLPRHSLLTIGDGDFVLTNEDIARRLRYLEASRPFRQGFGYNNAHYATAGHVAEVLAGQPWKQLLAERILDPLGMTGTSTYTPALSSKDFAVPHATDGTPVPFQRREYDLPSGGIVISAEDLGRWLLARLGGGVLSDGLLRMLHTPVVVSGEDLPFPELHAMGYALGNLAFSYRGHRLQLHGGNQIGFASQVIVLPDAQVGVAVLTNVHGSRLPMALSLGLVDLLLGLEPAPWGERLAALPTPAAPTPPTGSEPPKDLSSYAGTYVHPAYGDFSVSVDAGALRPSFHGLDDDLVLTHVDKHDWLLSHTRFDELRVPVSFRPDPGPVPDPGPGDVALGLEPELAPIVFPRR